MLDKHEPSVIPEASGGSGIPYLAHVGDSGLRMLALVLCYCVHLSIHDILCLDRSVPPAPALLF